MTRRGLDWTKKFPAIAEAVGKLPAGTALIDGELVVEGSDGISSFSLLQEDLKNGRHDRMVFYVFDLMHLDGADLKPLPLATRKAALARLLAKTGKRGPLRLSLSLTEPGPVLLKHACKMGLEGIVSKRADAAYHSGRGHDWIKTKCSDRQELVVAGFAPSSVDAHAVGALVLGYYARGKIALRRAHRHRLHPRERARALSQAKGTQTCEVGAGERAEGRTRRARAGLGRAQTGGGSRFPRLDAWRPGAAGFVPGPARGQAGQACGARGQDAGRESQGGGQAQRARAQRARSLSSGVTLSHPDRVYWADAGVSKRDLAEYYTQIWKWMRPHVVGRPIALLRCPEGASGQCFFQKHATMGIATEHLHLVPEKGDKIIAIDDLAGLIALVQAGVLEVHTRGTTIDDRERADRLVFDLDPGPGTGWQDVVAAAREVRKRLERVKLKSFVKTSGGKGLHVVLPIKPVPWDTAKDFCHAVAASMAADEPAPLHGDRGQEQTQQADFRRLPAQQPRGDGGRALLHPRAAGRAGLDADRMVRTRRAQGREPVHGAQSAGAAQAAGQGPVGGYRALPADAAEAHIMELGKRAAR